MTMWRSRIFWRLFGTHGVLLLAAIGLAGMLIVQRVEEHFLGQVEQSLHTKAVLVREAIRAQPPESLQERMLALRQEIATRITLIAADGQVLADSEEDPLKMENHASRPELQRAQDRSYGSVTRFSRTLRESMMYVALRIDEGGPVRFVRVALPLDMIEEQLSGLRRIVWTAAAITGVAALLLAFWLTRRLTRPIQELTAGAESIAAGAYGCRVYAESPDELGALARSFNRMSQELAVQFAQLQDDRQKMHAIFGGMVEGVVALDASQRVLFANDRGARLLEFPLPSAVGRKFWEVVRKRPIQEVVRRALNEPEPFTVELDWNGGLVQNLAVHAAPLPGAPVHGLVLVLHDTSELRRLERVRQEFVANVSHELKTPLSVIKACIETLLDGAVDDPQHRGPFLEKIAEQSERLHALILDLLSLARIESGTELFQVERVPLGPLVAACLESHRARAEAKHQNLEAVPTNPDRDEAAAWADDDALGQVLENLVDNALKYTPDGGRIRVRWWAEGEQVCLEVEDTGIGIPEKDLSHVFERFYRVDKARSRELGGTGLGLSIVKHLVQAMKGSIQASSRLGQGSTFRVRLPAASSS